MVQFAVKAKQVIVITIASTLEFRTLSSSLFGLCHFWTKGVVTFLVSRVGKIFSLFGHRYIHLDSGGQWNHGHSARKDRVLTLEMVNYSSNPPWLIGMHHVAWRLWLLNNSCGSLRWELISWWQFQSDAVLVGWKRATCWDLRASTKLRISISIIEARVYIEVSCHCCRDHLLYKIAKKRTGFSCF